MREPGRPFRVYRLTARMCRKIGATRVSATIGSARYRGMPSPWR